MTKVIGQKRHTDLSRKSIVVLYHAECSDGFGAAWAAHKKLGSSAAYIPVYHQAPPPAGLTGKEIYTVDFTYPKEITEQLAATNKRLTSIDHHASISEVAKATEGGVFDNDHSGAVLSWNYFNPGTPVPLLLQLVEDRDLYRFVLPDSEALCEWLDLAELDFKVYDKLARTLDTETGRRRAVRQGTLLKQYREKMVRQLVAHSAYEVRFEGYEVRAVTTEAYHSEAANSLAEGRPFGIAWRMTPHGVYVSLRSRNRVNVAELAGRYGGGGHANAAGFLVSRLEDLPFK